MTLRISLDEYKHLAEFVREGGKADDRIRQLYETLFYELLNHEYPNTFADFGPFFNFSLKATTNEMLDEALRLIEELHARDGIGKR